MDAAGVNYAAYILAAYGFAGAALLGLIVVSAAKYRQAGRRLQSLSPGEGKQPPPA